MTRRYTKLQNSSYDSTSATPADNSCRIAGCPNKMFNQATGYCIAHYARKRRGKDLLKPLRTANNQIDHRTVSTTLMPEHRKFIEQYAQDHSLTVYATLRKGIELWIMSETQGKILPSDS